MFGQCNLLEKQGISQAFTRGLRFGYFYREEKLKFYYTYQKHD